MSYVLGISSYYHDAAATLVKGGELIAAAQEERFSRKKNDPRFPRMAINYCLSEAFIDPSELDAVVFYDSPMLTLDRVVKNALHVAPSGRDQFVAACRTLLGAKARLALDVEETLGEAPPVLFAHHHLSHAASCFYPSPFEEAAILTIDGVGEWATCTLGVGSGSDVEILQEMRYPHSLGLLYSAFTYHCGFKVNSGEYKLMGLAPYGRPVYADLIRRELVHILEDGSFRLDTDAFGFLDSPLMTNAHFDEILGGSARHPEAPLTQREMDIAASVQVVAEDIVLKLVAHVVELTGLKSLTMAGGVALNCVANGRVLRESGLDDVFVQPAAGDAGGSLGAALLVSHQRLGVPRTLRPAASSNAGSDAPGVATRRDAMKGALLGPAFSSHEVEAFVDRHDAPSHLVEDSDERASIVAGALADGKIVGFFGGRMEFGPRSLGSRSILGDPRDPQMQRRMNLKIKFRESFRPFAPAVLAEHASEYFDLDVESPYMLFTAPVHEHRRLAVDGSGATEDMLAIINQQRSDVPAVTHVDYSARVQTVDQDDANSGFRRLLEAFHEQTGCPVLVNTSFNVRGEPIVCTPHDAYRCFMNTDIDLLVLEDRLLWKDEQKNQDEWKAEYEPD